MREPAPFKVLNKNFIRAIKANNGYDKDTMMVYADWLEENGDPEQAAAIRNPYGYSKITKKEFKPTYIWALYSCINMSEEVYINIEKPNEVVLWMCSPFGNSERIILKTGPIQVIE
jgi:uncharacterized protein (TIGR02996 family)